MTATVVAVRGSAAPANGKAKRTFKRFYTGPAEHNERKGIGEKTQKYESYSTD